MKKIILYFSLISLSSSVNAQWTSQGTGFSATTRGLSEIHIVDANTVWALAYDGSGAGNNVQEFTRTTDSGANWTSGTINIGDATLEINNITPISANTAWVSAINNVTGDPNNGVGYIYKTTNSGLNWTQQLATGFQTAGASFLNGVYFFDSNNGIAYGDPIGSGLGEFEVYRTTDGGTNWTQVSAATLPNPLSGEYGYNGTPTAIGNTLWFTTNKGRIYRTTDKGLTWNAYQQNQLTDYNGVDPTTGNGTTGSIHFSTESSGCLLKTVITGTTTNHAYTRSLATTSNGGQTWTPFVSFTGTRPIITYVPGTTIIVATAQASPFGSAVSTDNGTTWNDLEAGSTTQRGTSVFLNSTTGWCAGFGDGDPLGTTGIFKLTSTLANQSFVTDKFKVYPNPATSNVTISANDVGGYQLSVSDLSGKVVLAKSLNGIENTVDVSALSSGAYFFTLSSDNKKEVVKILKN